MATVWVQAHDWPKDLQRATFQPVIWAAMIMTAGSLSLAGAVTPETAKLFAAGVPVLVAGMLLGWKLYGLVGDAAFRKVILALLLFSCTPMREVRASPCSVFSQR